MARAWLRRALNAGREAVEKCLGNRWYVDRVVNGRPAAEDVRSMSAHERLEDALFTGLRLTDGLDIETAGQRYGIDVWARYGDDLQPFVEAGVLRRDGTRIRLTREGMLVANEVMQVFV